MISASLPRVLVTCACACVLASPAGAVPMQIVYADGAAEGFFDPELGAARRAAFEFAAETWATTLAGTTPVVVEATMDSLGGTGVTATLASAGATTIHRNFGGVPRTWYGAALASQIIAADINGPDVPEISIAFNADVDGPEILGSVGWYYGFDAQPGSDIDFVTIALHELGHGLNFFEAVDGTSGGWRADDDPGIFDRMLFRPGVGSFADMRAAERLAAIISGQLLWIGLAVVAFNGSAPAVYAPDPYQPGASIGHWDTSFSPDEVIEPFYTTAVHDLGLLLPAMVDMGWELAVETPTPRASPATPTPTEPPRPTQTPETTPRARRVQVYVTNFATKSVTVTDIGGRLRRAIIPLTDEHLGLAGIAIAPETGLGYVTAFYSRSVTLLNAPNLTRGLTLYPRFGYPNRPESVVMRRDGTVAYISNYDSTSTTGAGAVLVLDTATNEAVLSYSTGGSPRPLCSRRMTVSSTSPMPGPTR